MYSYCQTLINSKTPAFKRFLPTCCVHRVVWCN